MQIKASSWKSERKNNVQTVGNVSGTEKWKIHIMTKSLPSILGIWNAELINGALWSCN